MISFHCVLPVGFETLLQICKTRLGSTVGWLRELRAAKIFMQGETLKRHLLPWLLINRRTFDILRYEINATLLRVKNFVNPPFHFRKNGIQKRTGLLVNFGSGGRGLVGWINSSA
jgi:hypothetical protein